MYLIATRPCETAAAISQKDENRALKSGLQKFHRAAALARRIGKGILEIESRGFRPLTLNLKYIQELKKPSTIRFLTAAERFAFSIEVRNGKLFQQNKPYQTRRETGQPPTHAFIIAPDLKIYAAPLQPKRFHHSSFCSGGALIFAGELETNREGKMVQITNRSGHYKPSKTHFLQMLDCFVGWGIDLEKVELHEYSPISPNRVSVFSSAKIYLDSKGFCNPEEIRILN